MSDALRIEDPAARFRVFDPDPTSDVEAYRETFFKPARPRLVYALAAVSGVDPDKLAPWLAESGTKLVIEGLALDVIVDSIDDAWERLVVHDVVPDGATMPASWRSFVKTAGHLALLAGDWANVIVTESLANEAIALRAKLGGSVERAPTWVEIDQVDAFGTALVPPFSMAQYGQKYRDAQADFLRHIVAVEEAANAATNNLGRESINNAVAEESGAAVWYRDASKHRWSWTLAARGDEPKLETTVDKLPDLTRPLRAIRRLGYGLVTTDVQDRDAPALVIAAPSWSWPPRG